ncbi:MAG: diacylglycerol kinase family protein [Spirochaetia bacterium]|nr:diacylglycerol kinase family protein [Spirochaetia bacterium]
MKRKQTGALKSCTFLINPTRQPSSVRVLKKILKKRTSAEIIETSNREELSNEVVKFCKGPGENLVIWGGDGTVHDAINAMMIHPPQGKALGFLRGGTGNGIQDSYEIPWRISRQIETYIKSADNRFYEAVDLLKIETKQKALYGQLVGVGVDADILRLRNDQFVSVTDTAKDTATATATTAAGIRFYIGAGLKVLRTFDFKEVKSKTLTFTNGKYALKGGKINAEFPFKTLVRGTKSTLVEIGTRPYYGKGFKICPDVVCNDGKMDAYLFQFTNHFSVIRNIVSVWNGWHDRVNRHLVKAGYPLIERYEVESTVIRMEKPFSFHVDGELYHTGPDAEIRISIMPQVVNFLVPEHFYRKFHPFFFEEAGVNIHK